MRVSQDVLEVLGRAVTDGPALRLVGQLDRKLYAATNKALELAGGKWDRRAKAHLFPGDAAEAIEPLLLTGEIADAKREFQAFYTPTDLAAQVVERAGIHAGSMVLEPSAGEGALAMPALLCGGQVTAVELNEAAHAKLRTNFPSAIRADFLSLDPNPVFDRVVMNPPFTRQQDAIHVLHAAAFLRPGGRLVAIMSAAVTFRETAHYEAVRDLVARRGGTIERLPQGSFKASGTNVETALLTLPAEAA